MLGAHTIKARKLHTASWYFSKQEDLYLDRGELLRFSGAYSTGRHFDAYIPLSDEEEELDGSDHETQAIKTGNEAHPSDSSVGIWKEMQLTHPPLEALRVQVTGGKTTFFEPTRMPFAEYIDACAVLCKKEEETWVTNIGGEKWALTQVTVDRLTGFGMLAILKED